MVAKRVRGIDQRAPLHYRKLDLFLRYTETTKLQDSSVPLLREIQKEDKRHVSGSETARGKDLEERGEGRLGAASGSRNKKRRGQGNAFNFGSVCKIAINNHILEDKSKNSKLSPLPLFLTTMFSFQSSE